MQKYKKCELDVHPNKELFRVCPKYSLYLGQISIKSMKESTEKQILRRIKKAKRGTLFFSENFFRYGNTEAIRKALQRLSKTSELDRVARGIYVRPVIDSVIGKVSPSIELVAILEKPNKNRNFGEK
jgi:hypothetical protein